MTKKELQDMPEFVVLPAKLRQYILFTELYGKLHGTACRLLKLNKTRTKADPRILECQNAIRSSHANVLASSAREVVAPERFDHTNSAEMYECVRRISRDLGEEVGAGNPSFARTTFVYPEGHVTHAWLLEKGLAPRLVPDAT